MRLHACAQPDAYPNGSPKGATAILELHLLALKQTTLLILAILSVIVLCDARVAAQEQFKVVSVNLRSSTPVGTKFDYTYSVQIRNEGSEARGVTATVTSSSPDSVIVGHGDLAFGDIPAGEVISSSNTFTLRRKRSVPFDPAALSFVFQVGAPNMAPVADAGSNQVARPGQTVQLDGSRSHDPDGTIAAYSWSYVGSIPAGLAASLSDPSAVKPSVFIAEAGTYVFQLFVTDDAGATSAPAQVRIRTGPVASAGPARTVKVGQIVQLDGSKSFDPEGLPLTFHWTFLPPPGSKARLSDPTAAKPTVVVDVAGTYYIQLTVTNGAVSSEPNGVEITATTGLLMCGDLVSGSIGAGQIVPYTFKATAVNEILTVTLVDTGGFASGAAVVSLFAPSGQLLTSFGANNQAQVTLPAAGTYAIKVMGSSSTATGQYNLGLDCRNPTAPVKAVLGCGALEPGSLTAKGQVDQYTFQGTAANEILTVTLVDTGGFASGGVAVVSLFAPSGQLLTSFGANSQRQVPLPAAGTYVLQVVGSGFTALGQYNLGLDCRNPTAPVKAVLGCGALEPGSLIALGQVDQYTFPAQANQILTLTLVDTGGFASGGVAVVSLFAPSGQLLTSFGANNHVQVPLPAAGTYVLQVVGSGFTALGQYSVNWQFNPGCPVCTLSPTRLTFATQLVGTASTAKTVTATNTGKATMTFTGISLTGTNRTGFQQTHTCGATLAVGAKCTISVSFKPTASGTRIAGLSIADNAAPPNPQTVVLSGTGTVVELVPTSLSFGDQSVGTTSVAETVTMTNVGTTMLTISGISVTGINAGDFSQTHTCGGTLGAGASCSISVKFHPSATGARSAAISISDNGGSSPQKVPLSGTGT